MGTNKAKSSMLSTFIQMRDIEHRVYELMPMCGHLDSVDQRLYEQRLCGYVCHFSQSVYFD